MNIEQLQNAFMEQTKQISALQESVKSAHHRIDRMDQLTEAVHTLAQSNTAIATEVKMLTSKFDKTIERMEKGQKCQGERLGTIERDITQIRRNEKEIGELSAKFDAVRMEPAEKWKYLIFAIIGGIVAGVLNIVGSGFPF
jgi:DNA repair exonuclease SbcCD ATPase subunit